MQSATDAGRSARTTTDAPHPQEPHATSCDRCQTRSADGVAPDGRSLCAGCADDERTLVCDGGESLESVQNEPVPDDEAREVPA